ncbi:MAG: hypothetical protein B7X09_02925 [Acidiphilium sp. 21-66-27]|nr:MAG: hypothetical protein B7Z76_13690 [Acidiphilium sp. 20-67-58]OYV66803.1 MAG: hypothetical protein B7X09_02925 [Acidiphilium sp. 21-66-27]
MPLYIRDDATAELVAKLAKERGLTKQDAVRLAVQAELDRTREARGRLREGAKSYAKVLASDILR